MSARGVLRSIGDPVVAAGPAGVRIRTRLHLSAGESDALIVLGGFLGSVYRRELAGRIALGRLDRRQHGVWRAQRKAAVTAVSSSRWAGAITRAVEDQYQLGMRALAAHVSDLGAAVAVLQARCALRPVSSTPPPAMTASVTGGVAAGGREGIAPQRNGSSRPAGWRSCSSAWPWPRRRWRRADRRSRSAVNGCGSPASTSRKRD